MPIPHGRINVKSSILDLSALHSAVTSLADGLGVVGDASWFDRQSSQVKNTLMAGVIQNFEFVYEIGVKMIKRTLERDSANPAEVDAMNFRDMLRLAGESGLIDDVEAWFTYRTMRNVTAHTYDHEKARQIYQGALTFIGDAQSLLARLEVRNG